MHWVVLSSRTSWHILQNHQSHGTLNGPRPPFCCVCLKISSVSVRIPFYFFNGLLKCPLPGRVSYISCLLGWFSHLFLLVTEADIACGIGDFFPMGTGMEMCPYLVLCEDTRLFMFMVPCIIIYSVK